MTSFLLTSLPHQHASPDVELLLIGNKCDLEEERAVESERGEQLARSYNISFMETSAKTGHNIDEVRGHLMMSLYDVITSGMLHHPGVSLSECLIKSNPCVVTTDTRSIDLYTWK